MVPEKLSLSGRGLSEAFQVKCVVFSLKYASEKGNKQTKIKGGSLKLDFGYMALPLYTFEKISKVFLKEEERKSETIMRSSS